MDKNKMLFRIVRHAILLLAIESIRASSQQQVTPSPAQAQANLIGPPPPPPPPPPHQFNQVQFNPSQAQPLPGTLSQLRSQQQQPNFHMGHQANQIQLQMQAPLPPPPPGSDETCGLSMMGNFRHERIVGGWNASYAEVPFIAHLKESQMFRILGYNKCGGCLLNHRFALTAGHCKPAFFSSLEIILGKQKTFEDAPPPEGSAMANIFKMGATKRPSQHSQHPNEIGLEGHRKQPVVQVLAETFIVHPDYDAKTLENDLALIKFKEPIPYREDIQPICLPAHNEDFTGLDGYATGWGLTNFDKRQLPDTLQVVRLPLMHNKRCQSMYKKAGHDKLITEFDLCAGYAKGGMDACEGDSGGPLVVRRPSDHRWTLAGIVSNGVKCGEPLLPGVYTRVSKFVPWILEQMRLHS